MKRSNGSLFSLSNLLAISIFRPLIAAAAVVEALLSVIGLVLIIRV